MFSGGEEKRASSSTFVVFLIIFHENSLKSTVNILSLFSRATAARRQRNESRTLMKGFVRTKRLDMAMNLYHSMCAQLRNRDTLPAGPPNLPGPLLDCIDVNLNKKKRLFFADKKSFFRKQCSRELHGHRDCPSCRQRSNLQAVRWGSFEDSCEVQSGCWFEARHGLRVIFSKFERKRLRFDPRQGFGALYCLNN